MLRFMVSLAGVAVCGSAILFLCARALYRKYKGRNIAAAPLAIACVALLVVAAFAGYHTVVSGYALAQRAITEVVRFGTVAVLEGFGQSYDHFQDKWRREALDDTRALTLSVARAEVSKDEPRVLTLVLRIRNTGDSPIDLNRILEQQHVLLKDSDGVCHPLRDVNYANSMLPPGIESGREISIQLPANVHPQAVVTPFQELPLALGPR